MDDLGLAQNYAFATVNEHGIVDYADQNKGITPIFYTEVVPDEAATEKAGAIRMREQEIVRIHVAGDSWNVATHPVTDEIKQRFAKHYEAFKAKRAEMHIEGTPLKHWPLLPALRIAEFNALNIFSVEDLAAVSDGNIHKLQDGRIWREKANAWLQSAKENGAAARYAAENERLREDMNELKRQIEALKEDRQEEKRGPGRPRKDAA